MHSQNHFTPFGAPASVPISIEIRTAPRRTYNLMVAFWFVWVALSILSSGHAAYLFVEAARDLDRQYAMDARR
jgi:hypothetical protein